MPRVKGPDKCSINCLGMPISLYGTTVVRFVLRMNRFHFKGGAFFILYSILLYLLLCFVTYLPQKSPS